MQATDPLRVLRHLALSSSPSDRQRNEIVSEILRRSSTSSASAISSRSSPFLSRLSSSLSSHSISPQSVFSHWQSVTPPTPQYSADVLVSLASSSRYRPPTAVSPTTFSLLRDALLSIPWTSPRQLVSQALNPIITTVFPQPTRDLIREFTTFLFERFAAFVKSIISFRFVGTLTSASLRLLSKAISLLLRIVTWLFDWADWLFVPKKALGVFRRHLLALCILFVLHAIYRYLLADLVIKARKSITVMLLDPMARRSHSLYSEDLDQAKTFPQWESAAIALDKLEGYDKWRNDSSSRRYDSARMSRSLLRIRRLYDAGDVQSLMWTIRSSLERGNFGMTNHQLYSVLRTGTKRLIEDYLDELTRVLQLICVHPAIPLEEKLNFFNETRHAHGRSALLLSGGATLGLYHTGVIKALHECKLLPKVISGSSVGSIIAAMIGTRKDHEINELFRVSNGSATNIKLNFFQKESVFAKIHRLFTQSTLLDIMDLAKAVCENVPKLTFQEVSYLIILHW